jgi:hypothetical protein
MSLSSSSYFTITNTTGCSYWQPDCKINNEIKSASNITSNWKYRQYMQSNANQIMKYNAMESIYASGNNPYALNNTISSPNVPRKFDSLHDESKPFINSDLKQSFLKKQQFNATLIAPSIPTDKF